MEENIEQEISQSPTWTRSTKVIVTVAALLVLALVAYRFQSLLHQLIIAAILAYLLNPIIIIVDSRTSLKRVHAILLIYLGLAIVVIGALTAIGVAAFDQSRTLINDIPSFITGTTAVIQNYITNLKPINIGTIQINPRDLNWVVIQNQLIGLAEPTLGRSGQIVRSVATATITLLGNIFFIFVISIYFAAEIPFLKNHVGEIAQAPGYRQDADRLMREFGRIWNSYLRGQVVLALVIFFVVWIGLTILGVQNSLALGILAGLLEFIPVIGPIISAIAAVIVAFFQPETFMGLESWQYALAVLAFMILVQQLENNILVPRIVGDSLELNPIVVMIAVLMGGSIAGILGMILAAPVMATIKLVGGYGWRKLFDLPPFPRPEKELEPSAPQVIIKRGREIITDLTKPEAQRTKTEKPKKE